MITDTSFEAYEGIRLELGSRHKDIVRALIVLKEANNREIAAYLGIAINSVTPRVNEMVKFGRIKQVGYKIDGVTKRRTMIWGLI